MTIKDNFLESLRWRYATKKYDSTKKLTLEQLENILEATRLSPSSFGIQPWKIIVVENIELRKKLREAAWNQSPITEASHLLIFCSPISMGVEHVKSHVVNTAEVRGVSIESIKNFETTLLNFVNNKTTEDLNAWAKRQVYLALGITLAAAAVHRIDSTPMEGFDATKFNEILDLEKQGWQSVVLCALGFRDAEDFLVKQKKVRFDKKDVLTFVR